MNGCKLLAPTTCRRLVEYLYMIHNCTLTAFSCILVRFAIFMIVPGCFSQLNIDHRRLSPAKRHIRRHCRSFTKTCVHSPCLHLPNCSTVCITIFTVPSIPRSILFSLKIYTHISPAVLATAFVIRCRYPELPTSLRISKATCRSKQIKDTSRVIVT